VTCDANLDSDLPFDFSEKPDEIEELQRPYIYIFIYIYIRNIGMSNASGSKRYHSSDGIPEERVLLSTCVDSMQ